MVVSRPKVRLLTNLPIVSLGEWYLINIRSLVAYLTSGAGRRVNGMCKFSPSFRRGEVLASCPRLSCSPVHVARPSTISLYTPSVIQGTTCIRVLRSSTTRTSSAIPIVLPCLATISTSGPGPNDNDPALAARTGTVGPGPTLIDREPFLLWQRPRLIYR